MIKQLLMKLTGNKTSIGNRKSCCRRPWNLFDLPSGRNDLRIQKCKKCNCRHFTAKAQPGRLSAMLTGFGKKEGVTNG